MKAVLNPTFLKTLLIGSVITGVIVVFGTSQLFFEPLYRAEALIYVPLTIPSKQIEQQGIGFASDIEIDGHIQIFQSGRLHDSLITRFDFSDAFDIDLTKSGELSNLYKKIDSRINFEKTRYSSVSVSVLDPEPERAAEIANEIVELGDVIKEDILYENRRKVFLQAKSYYENKLTSVTELENRIDSLDNAASGNNLNRKEDNLLFKLKNQYATEIQELASRKNHLETVEHDFNAELPKSYVISKAIPVTTPVWPPRKLITAASVLAYIFILLVFAIVKHDVNSKQ